MVGAEQELESQLIEPLVAQAAGAQCRTIKGVCLQRGGLLACERAAEYGHAPIVGVDLSQ